MDIEEMTPEEIEETARGQGWTPEDEWKGEPPSRGFVTAEAFLSAGKESLPLQTQQLNNVKEELEALKADNAKIKAQTSRYVAMTDKKMAADRDKIDDLIGEQQKLRSEAISAADGDAVLEAEGKIAELQSESAQLQTPDPAVTQWVDDNEWYTADPVLRDLADGMSIRLRAENPALEGRAHLDELSKRVKDAMPDKFKNPNRDNAPPVTPPQRTPQSNGKTFDDLPTESKEAFADFREMFKAMGKDYTKEQYLANYEWEAK